MSQSPEQPDRPSGQLPGRTRGWIAAAGVLALTAAYVLGWMTYAYVHLSSNIRYTVAAPGAEVAMKAGRVRLLELGVADSLTSTYRSQPAKAPDPGAVWVVATTEVTVESSGRGAYCVFELIGQDGRAWESDSTVVGRQLPGSCSEDAVPKGRPTRIETIFEVPATDASRLLGLAVVDDDTTWHRMVLMRP